MFTKLSPISHRVTVDEEPFILDILGDGLDDMTRKDSPKRELDLRLCKRPVHMYM